MLGGSCICPPAKIQEMLELAAKQDIKPWIEKRDLETEVNKTVVDMEDGKARLDLLARRWPGHEFLTVMDVWLCTRLHNPPAFRWCYCSCRQL
jgi:hypothetical protein